MPPAKKYWILVSAKDQVRNGTREGFAQAPHGKALPLKHMNKGDGLIYYSPKIQFGSDLSCQEFTAIGIVSDEEVYPHVTGTGFKPYRRNIKYLPARSVSIRPLINKLEFINDKTQWGHKFKFGTVEISYIDFQLIAGLMKANLDSHL